MSNYRDLLPNRRSTPATEKADPRQVPNSGGGFSFTLDPLAQLERFLVLGSSKPTYYAGARELTAKNAEVVAACFADDALRDNAITLIGQISNEGRAPKNSPAILAAALAVAHPDVTTAQAKLLVDQTCRTGTHVFELAGYVNQMRGWGRKARAAVGSWYTNRDVEALAYQFAKYKQRGGFSHRDVMRLAHPSFPAEDPRHAVAGWACGRKEALPELLQEVERLSGETDEKVIAKAVAENRALSWEMLPSDALRSQKVWRAMVERGLPITALIRNLGRLGSLNLLTPLKDGTVTESVITQLTSERALQKGRVHPMTLFTAAKVYAQGRGVKGNLTWVPNSQIGEALQTAFYMAFDQVEPTGKNHLIALDVSASMTWHPCAGAELVTPREASAVMSMMAVRAEPNTHVIGFSRTTSEIGITPSDTFDAVLHKIGQQRASSTNIAAAISYAQQNDLDVDAFVIYTDNEVNSGTAHPFQALRRYRGGGSRRAKSKLIVCGMTATDFTIADPTDPGMLDVAGFDSAAPKVIADFVR